MKKLVCFACALCMSNGSSAYSQQSNLYFGVDYEYLHATRSDNPGNTIFPSKFTALAAYIDWFFVPTLGVELGASQTNKKDFTSVQSGMTVDTRTEIKSYTVDLMTRLPLTYDASWNALGSVGAGRYTLTTDILTGGTETKSGMHDTTIRYGLGFDYHFTRRLGFRAMIHYAQVSFKDPDDGIQNVYTSLFTTNLGLNYRF